MHVNPSIKLFRAARAWRTVLAAGIVLTLAACATSPKLYVDAMDEPLGCSSIAWLESSDRPASIPEQRIRTEVLATLEAMGYVIDEEAPDCLVHGLVFTGARPGSPVSVGLGAGRWGGSFGGSVGVSMPMGGGSRTVSNLAIDVINVERNAEVWRGTVESAFSRSDPSPEEVAAAVRHLLESFPLPGAG
jgi:hypothetical protein